MANKMIIDASHPEETRVVVLRGNRVEEFDFESASKRQLRGNIYLAKVTRVEPSLQAAFVEYGGNRHGFLAFSEIHPDYYQIPVADRQALLEDEARRHAEDEDEEQGQKQKRSRRNRDERGGRAQKRQPRSGDSVSEALPAGDSGEHSRANETDAAWSDHAGQQARGEDGGTGPAHAQGADIHHHDGDEDRARHHADEGDGEPGSHGFGHIEEVSHEHSGSDEITTLGGDEDGDDEHGTDEDAGDEHEGQGGRQSARRHAAEGDHEDADAAPDDDAAAAQTGEPDDDGEAGEAPRRAFRPRRNYKIQEVIKRRQVMLVQVVKEERGNKGAALTSYLSLAGRYSVLMPNTARGGGISRKITNNVDRKRLKEIAQELEVPDGMGIILRTAGASRSKPEVKRDFEYLLRMWEQVRELTLKSSAPMLTYEEGSLIKRAIRDLYSKEIDEVIVAGEAGYREAKDFMRMLMPGHSKNVIAYRDPQPIFARAGVEAQLDAMFAAQVTLKSGGYIVINQTEALVAIDVNSGRSTREHNIEDTALRTNLEAADEIARQLRLRDLAGLIVIDFIDMEEHRNNRSVERRIKDALRNDRARIQIGRISHFGLLEMSRQRIRTGVLEGSTVMCAHCMGAGTVRSTASIALHVLRVVEDALTRNAAFNINVRTRTTVALYILNQKRSHLRELERRFGVTVNVGADDMLTGVTYHAIERGEAATPVEEALATPAAIAEEPEIDEDFVEEAEDFTAAAEPDDSAAESEDDGGRAERAPRHGGRQQAAADGEEDRNDDRDDKGRKRRRRRRGGRNGEREATDIAANAPQPPDDALAAISEITEAQLAGTPPETAEPVTQGASEDQRPRSRRSRGGRGRSRNQRESVADAADGVAEASDFPAPAENAGESAVAQAQDVAPPKTVFWPVDAGVTDAPAPEVATEQAADAGVARDHVAQVHVAQDHVARDHVAQVHVAAQVADSVTEPAAFAAAERPELVSTSLDPGQPKKSGWWKRAAASFGSPT